MHLAEEGSETILTYVANAQVGGKLAQLGGRLIDSTAKKLADQFFACFAERAGTPASAAMTSEAATSEAVVADPAPAEVAGRADADAGRAGAAGGDRRAGRRACRDRHHGRSCRKSPAGGACRVDVARARAAVERCFGGGAGARDANREIKREAAVGFLGGPIVWGLLVILALLAFYVFAV